MAIQKALDLLVEKNGKVIQIQVKGMQRKALICWNISLSKLKGLPIIYVLVNLNADTLERPEYFVLTEEEVLKHFKSVNSGLSGLQSG